MTLFRLAEFYLNHIVGGNKYGKIEELIVDNKEAQYWLKIEKVRNALRRNRQMLVKSPPTLSNDSEDESSAQVEVEVERSAVEMTDAVNCRRDRPTGSGKAQAQKTLQKCTISMAEASRNHAALRETGPLK